MTQDARPPRRNLKQVRILLWVLVALAIAGAAALILFSRRSGERHLGPGWLRRRRSRWSAATASRSRAPASPASLTRSISASPAAATSARRRSARLVKLRTPSRRRRGVQHRLRHHRPGERRAEGSRPICRPVQRADHRPDRQPGADRPGQEAIWHLSPSRCRTRRCGKEMEHTATVLLFDRDGQVRRHHRARRAGQRGARQAEASLARLMRVR